MKFETPEVKVVLLTVEDILTTSSTDESSTGGGNDCPARGEDQDL